MYVLLADIYGNRRSNLIFSTSYALSGFLVANVFQVIFFTCTLMLPLMVFGLQTDITREEFFSLFSVSYVLYFH